VLPALAQAQSVQSRATKAGIGDVRPAPIDENDADSLGELLFRVVAAARERNIDAEEALRAAIQRYRARVGEEETERATT
jgi:XTP/dITP diphosphohydrolase